jgi:hypothetical protein
VGWERHHSSTLYFLNFLYTYGIFTFSTGAWRRLSLMTTRRIIFAALGSQFFILRFLSARLLALFSAEK